METTTHRNLDFYQTYGLHQYYKDYVSYNSNLYQLQTSHWELTQLSKRAEGKDIRRVLLIGLGFGRELDHLLKAFPYANIAVLDFNDQFINPARSIYSSDRTSFANHDLNKGTLPFPDQSFDLIISLNTLEYLEESPFHAFFGESARALKPGGLLFFRLYNASFPFSFIDQRHIKLRSASLPVVYPRPFEETKISVEKNLSLVKVQPLGYRIQARLFNVLYTDPLSSITWTLEKLISRILPVGKARSIYFTGVKND